MLMNLVAMQCYIYYCISCYHSAWNRIALFDMIVGMQ